MVLYYLFLFSLLQHEKVLLRRSNTWPSWPFALSGNSANSIFAAYLPSMTQADRSRLTVKRSCLVHVFGKSGHNKRINLIFNFSLPDERGLWQ